MDRTCCITGHRDLDAEQLEKIQEALEREIKRAAEEGYASFLTGFSSPAGQRFAQAVLELKKEDPKIELRAVIPYKNKLDEIRGREECKKFLEACADVLVLEEKYQPDIYVKVNRYLAEQSDRAIVVYDGREDGLTVDMIRRIHRMKKELREIPAGLEIRCPRH